MISIHIDLGSFGRGISSKVEKIPEDMDVLSRLLGRDAKSVVKDIFDLGLEKEMGKALSRAKKERAAAAKAAAEAERIRRGAMEENDFCEALSLAMDRLRSAKQAERIRREAIKAQ